MRLLTLARDLRRRRARERQSLFIAEGVRAVEELLRSPLRVRGVLVADAPDDAARRGRLVAAVQERGIATERVGAADFATAAETETPQGILAVGEVPTRGLELLDAPLAGQGNHRLLVLDAVQDPGNVGTLLRTAAALGALATIALPGTVDLWNAKVVRSAVGAHFHHPAFGCTWAELTTFLADRDIALWGADGAGEPFDAVLRDGAPVPARLALAVGNEGSGLSTTTRERADRTVALPLATTVESLNVAVAAGILLYGLRR